MAKLDEIFAGGNLVQTYQDIQPGIEHSLPPAFMTVTDYGERDVVTYIRIPGSRQVAAQVMYDAKSVGSLPKGATRVSANMIHSRENEPISTELLGRLRSDDENTKRLALQQLMGQLLNFRVRGENLRVASIYSLLTLGAIYFDGSGNLLPSASGAVVSISFGVPAGNQGQLNIDGAGAAIAASWATASTDIPSHVRDIKDQMMKTYGYRIRHAHYGPNLTSYLLKNDNIKDLVVNNPGYNASFAAGEIPDGLLGLTWTPLEGHFEDATGTIQTFYGGDSLILHPDVERSWYGFAEGTYPVPGSLSRGDADTIIDSIMTARGPFAYAELAIDPVSILMYHGDTFLPILRNPNALLIGDVTP